MLRRSDTRAIVFTQYRASVNEIVHVRVRIAALLPWACRQRGAVARLTTSLHEMCIYNAHLYVLHMHLCITYMRVYMPSNVCVRVARERRRFSRRRVVLPPSCARQATPIPPLVPHWLVTWCVACSARTCAMPRLSARVSVGAPTGYAVIPYRAPVARSRAARPLVASTVPRAGARRRAGRGAAAAGALHRAGARMAICISLCARMAICISLCARRQRPATRRGRRRNSR